MGRKQILEPKNSLSWPTPVKAEAYTESVNLSVLSPARKKEAWTYLKANHPQVAQNLKEILSDPMLLHIMQEFDGGILVEAKYLPPTFREAPH